MSGAPKALSSAKVARQRRQAEEERREKRKNLRLLAGIVLLLGAIGVADYVWIKDMARLRRAEHERQYHRGQTNAPAQSPHQTR